KTSTATTEALQQQLIELQAEVIRLHQKLEKLTPEDPDLKDIRWHLFSDGVMSDELITSADHDTLKKYRKWLHEFGEKHVRPYVHNNIYIEIMTHMGRGIARRMAKLEVNAELGIEEEPDTDTDNTLSFPSKDTPSEEPDKPQQPPLLSDDATGQN
ncbi:MAG: hypothetical protein AAF787_24565, partial [Chloroflexota bacterium]